MTHYTNTSNPIDFPKQSTIDRLWGEALDRAVPDTYSTLTWTQVEKIKKVFAELIVGECVRKIEDIAESSNDPQPIYRVAVELLEHFGVEE